MVLEYQRQAYKDKEKREKEQRERIALQMNAERERQVRAHLVLTGFITCRLGSQF